MPVMILEQPMYAGQQSNVAVSVTAHGHPAAIVESNLEILGNFQKYTVPALNEAIQAERLVSFRRFKYQGFPEIVNERMLTQSAVVNVSVVVPGVPVVGVVSRKNFSPS